MASEHTELSKVQQRADIPHANRIVVKIGSSSLSDIKGGLNTQAVVDLVDALGEVIRRGNQVVLVSSGAIAAGLAPMGLTSRPKDLATQQAAAAVGQVVLAAQYSKEFGRYGETAAQVLLTADDLIRRGHYANAFRSLSRLLSLGIVPIVNENDAVATSEIRFGDNDRLAALVANLVKADALVLLSDVDAVYTAHPERGGEPIDTVTHPSDLADVELGSAGSAGVGTGGMQTKVAAATIAAQSGIPTLVTSAANASKALAGEDVGTFFAAQRGRRSLKRLWLEHLAEGRGRLVLDDGAVKAIASGTNSLLAAGIIDVRGEFIEGEPVDITNSNGVVIARGFSSFASDEIPDMLGLTSDQLREDLGDRFERPVVHADELAVFGSVFAKANPDAINS